MNQQSTIHSTSAVDTLEFSELHYRRLFETAQDGILILNANSGKIYDANPFLITLLDYSPPEILGQELWEIGAFKHLVPSKSAFHQMQRKKCNHYNSMFLRTKYGKFIEVEIVSSTYLVNSQKVIQCNIRDITNRRKIEKLAEFKTKELERLNKSQEETKKAMLNVMEDLKEAKTLLEVEKVKDEAMLTSIGEGIIAIDNDRKIIVINSAAEHMLGWNKKDLLGRNITDLLLEDDEGKIVPVAKRPTYIALTTGKMTKKRFFFVRKDKTRFPIAITVTPIKLGKKIIGAIDIFRDITREEETDRAKSEFVSLASHQLRTPLGIAKWYIEAMRKDEYLEKNPEQARDYLEEVYKSNERLLALVRNLLSISRIDQGKDKHAPQVINIIDVVKDVIKSMKIFAYNNSVTIQLNIKKNDIPPIFIDPLRVQQVIENLIVNAITYSHSPGTVELTLDTQNDKILLCVKDRGIGISALDKKRVFTKFFRSEKAMNINTEGSGLGLYVVKSYIDAWGGTIEVTSSEKKGTTFSVTLPFRNDNNTKVN